MGAISRRVRITKALTRWSDAVLRGEKVTLEEIAAPLGLTPRLIRKAMAEDKTLEAQVFGPSMAQARLGLATAVGEAFTALSSTNTDSATKHRWAVFLAKLVGGGYERADRGPTVEINMVPELPAGFKHIEFEVKDGGREAGREKARLLLTPPQVDDA